MKPLVFLFSLLAATFCQAQSAGSINFSSLYNLQSEIDFQIHPVQLKDSITVFYSLKPANPAKPVYVIQWEKRDSYSQRQGEVIFANDSLVLRNGFIEKKFRLEKPIKPWLLVAKISQVSSGKTWTFFKQIEAHYPVNGYLEVNGVKQWSTFQTASRIFTVRGSGSGLPIHFSYYQDNFPTPSPPFADKEQKMDRFLFPDSTFTVQPGQSIGPFKKEGLYLAQEDTTSSLGFSFMIEKEPYPKYNTLGDLKGPLLFVTTKEENDAIGNAGEDKSKFDKVILDITDDRDRAKNFMRNYFKRVELANLFFTSFKEGWKTDRGMIYIVFGAPDQVNISGQQEIWNYNSPRQQFVFVKSGSVYNPDHYVLIRDKQYTEDWYQTIDLWRKNRL